MSDEKTQEEKERWADEETALVTHLRSEITRLRAALSQFAAVCDTVPPVSLMTELRYAYEAATAALSNGDEKCL